MEYLEGVELIDFLNTVACSREEEGGLIPEFYLRYIFTKVILALHKLHKAGVAHRDLKAENIMLTSDFRVVLIDAGHWVPTHGDGGYYVTDQQILGTPGYRAPEILEKLPY